MIGGHSLNAKWIYGSIKCIRLYCRVRILIKKLNNNINPLCTCMCM